MPRKWLFKSKKRKGNNKSSPASSKQSKKGKNKSSKQKQVNSSSSKGRKSRYRKTFQYRPDTTTVVVQNKDENPRKENPITVNENYYRKTSKRTTENIEIPTSSERDRKVTREAVAQTSIIDQKRNSKETEEKDLDKNETIPTNSPARPSSLSGTEDNDHHLENIAGGNTVRTSADESIPPPANIKPILKSYDGKVQPELTDSDLQDYYERMKKLEARRVSIQSRVSTISRKSASRTSLGHRAAEDLANELLQMFSSVDHVWLEHSKHHVGSQSPNPYEYDVYAGVHQRILYVMPLFEKNASNVEVKRGLGFANTLYVIPSEFSCLSPIGQDICHISWEVIQKCCSGPRIKMDVLVMGIPLGMVTQGRRGDISIHDNKGQEVITIKEVPMPSSWVCTASSRPFTCKILKSEHARDPSIIGVIGRNGPDTKAVIFGQPLGFYFHLKGSGGGGSAGGKESKKRIKLDDAARVCLLSVLVGLMTTYVNKKQ